MNGGLFVNLAVIIYKCGWTETFYERGRNLLSNTFVTNCVRSNSKGDIN